MDSPKIRQGLTIAQVRFGAGFKGQPGRVFTGLTRVVFNIPPGGDLFSHSVSKAVSSALGRFTTVFGMDTGGATPLEPPGSTFTSPVCTIFHNLASTWASTIFDSRSRVLTFGFFQPCGSNWDLVPDQLSPFDYFRQGLFIFSK